MTVCADGRGRRGVAELERVDRTSATAAVGEEADLLHVATLVERGELGLDRVGRGRLPVLRRVLETDDVGAVVSAVAGSRCVMARATSSLRVARSTCSRPKPKVTVSRVEMIAPPVGRLGRGRGVVGLDRLLAQRLVGPRRAPVAQAHRRLGQRGAVPSAFWFGSLPAVASTVNGVMPAKNELRRRGDRGACRTRAGAPEPARGRRRRGSSATCRWRSRASAGTPCRAGRRRPPLFGG